jgi:hypothetical protein
MKYVDTEALARLFGKVLPFSADYFAKQIEKTLVKINAGMVRPEYAGAADVLLANNRANKQGIWKVYNDYDFDIVTKYIPYNNVAGGKFDTSLNVGSKAGSKTNKKDWRVLYHLKIENQFNGTPWQIVFPLQIVMKYYPHKTKGTYFGYSHGITLMDEKDSNKDEYYYIGVTRRNWLTRMAEHFREINSGSNKTFHRAWRNHIGRRDVVLTSELVVANHTFDEIMQWEEDLVDRDMAAGISLNMIPGGFKGMRFLHEHRLTKSPVVSLKERERANEEYQRQHPRAGIPNLLISELWKDDEWAAKTICGPADRLSEDQVRGIRALGDEGLPPEEIAERVGARNVLQVKRVLSGKTYRVVH